MWSEMKKRRRFGPEAHSEIEVIPADLGRELYEAITEELDGETPERLVLAEALARYEREVGT